MNRTARGREALICWGMLRRLAVVCVLLSAVSCGGSGTPVESAKSEPSDEVSGGKASPPSEAESTPPDEKTKAADTPIATESAERPEGREIKYIVAPEGLEVEVAGVRFTTAVKPIQVAGGWGVRVSATGKSMDGKAHSLSSPKAGPIALAGNVKRAGKAEHFLDTREGDGEKTIEASAPLEISREWPAKGEKPLHDGDEIELDVGLWGLGDDAASRRPVRAFFVVKMVVGKKKPQPVITPPPTGKE
jgi:hypothetical protein